MKKLLIWVASSLPLFAMAQSQNPLTNCYSELESKPELQILRNKVALGNVNEQTIEMLANKQKASPKERAALLSWGEQRKACTDGYLNWMQSQYPTNIVSVNIRLASDFKIALSDLYAGELTFGQFARRRQENQSKANTELAAIQTQNQKDALARQDVQVQQQAQESAQRRAIAAQIIMNNQANQARQSQVQPYQMQTLPQTAPLKSPTNTNCTSNGTGGFNCTTY